jgi:lysyl endopeptidase
MKKFIPLLLAMLIAFIGQAQVITNYNNTEKIGNEGKFKAAYRMAVQEVAPPDLKNALARDKAEAQAGSKIIYIAEPVALNVNLQKAASWVRDGEMEYGRFTLYSRGAQTLSINFSDFYLPKGTEIFIYNKEGEMITGPVTEAENNELKTWGSSIFKGDEVTVEVKVPAALKDELSLKITNMAYGYKQIFIEKTVGFGLSGACNINVLCAAGNGWAAERNAVAFIATSTGAALCSGAMVMNTCLTNTPYVLTANHCFDGDNNVGGWRVFFQAWSATCTPSQNNNGVLFNGTTLRARWAPSDFCLVQLNTTPAANSGIHYAGWTRSTTAATSGVSIHHPRGDVMKISTYTTPLVRENNAVRCGTTAPGTLHWVVQWNQGITEPGSSGSPLFDQNRRIVGQLSGGPSSCAQPANCRLDMYGRFDDSWTGGGTNASRLSNWLDPSNSGAQTTNTTNIANLFGPTIIMNGPASICNSATAYSLTGVPAGTAVTWTSSSPGIASIAGAGATATLTPAGRGFVTITASFTAPAGCVSSVSRSISVNAPVTISSILQPGCNSGFQNWVLSASPTTNGSGWSWSIGSLGTNSQINIYSPSSPSTNVGVKGGGAVRLNYTDACGVARQDGVTVYSTCPAFRLAVSPNPASGNMVVSMNEPLAENTNTETEPAISPLRKIASKGQTVISLFELNTNLPMRQWKFNETKGQRYNMSLSGLRKGNYLLQVDRDNQTQVTRVMVQ